MDFVSRCPILGMAPFAALECIRQGSNWNKEESWPLQSPSFVLLFQLSTILRKTTFPDYGCFPKRTINS